MEKKKKKFLRYLPERDVLFFLGAGASHADGVPLKRHLLPMILSGDLPEINDSQIGKIVTEFINDNFKYDIKNNIYPELEAIFGFIDYFIWQDESLNNKYGVNKIREIKEYLIKLIHYIVDKETNKRSNYYQSFWEAIQEYNSNVSIITLNYDTLLEQAFDSLFRKFGYMDYAIDLMNHEKSPLLKDYNFWVNVHEPIRIEEGENPVPIKILKLHGSLNWKYCNCCNQTLLTPWDRKLDLNKGKFLGYTYPENIEYEYKCPVDGTEFQTLIMPPTYYITGLNQPVIQQLVHKAAREIRSAKRIVFIGYSLSDADIHIKSLLKKSIKDTTEVIVINPRQSKEMELSYKSIAGNTSFIYNTFEELVQNQSLIKKLLT